MKILLVNPPIPNFWYNDEYYLPSSMLYLAASLRQHGHSPQILDMKTLKKEKTLGQTYAYEESLCSTIRAFEPDMIGFGCLFSGNFPDVLRFATVCKEQFPQLPIVAGGIHFTIHAEKIMEQCPVFDLIVLGEGERSLPQLVAALTAGKSVAAIDGVAWRDSGTVKINSKASYIENPDEIPFPAYDLIKMQDYFVDTSAWHNPWETLEELIRGPEGLANRRYVCQSGSKRPSTFAAVGCTTIARAAISRCCCCCTA